ncbi:MAG TPA: hypothetical protein VFV58_27305 [Blastocatellia bacterium]|nr:hypothetical protein [Blastocatellia bacterium]
MKRNAMIIALAGALCALGGTMALAKSKSHMITFEQDMLVNGAHVKKGEYQARFNDQNNELTILDGNRAIVTTTVKEEALAKKAPMTSFEVKTGANGAMLTKITFEGAHYALLLSDNQAAEGQ